MTTFSDLFTFSRSTGATRVNEDGLIVGVDFSSTSNTIGTGSKTFVLAATANVNRSWSVGEKVVAVSQAGATGSMTGTVTSYVASTQTLIIDVTSITGSGTSTDWRIGSLEFRYDYNPVTLAPRGGLVEGQVSNLFTNSGNITVGATFNVGVVSGTDEWAKKITGTDTVAVFSGAGDIYVYRSGAVASTLTTISVFVKMADGLPPIFGSSLPSSGLNDFAIVFAGGAPAPTSFIVTNFGNGVYRVSATAVSGSVTGNSGVIRYSSNSGRAFSVTGYQMELSSISSSYVPTTTVSVTRAADLTNIDGTRFSDVYNQSQGTLYLEMAPIASTIQAVATSFNDGSINNEIAVGKKSSNAFDARVVKDSISESDLVLPSILSGQKNKVAVRIKPNNFAVSVNGEDPVIDNTTNLPLVNRLSVGMSGAQTLPFNGHIRKMIYYPVAMNDQQLKNLTV